MDERETSRGKFRLRCLKTVLFKRPVLIFCDDCGKDIPSTMEWVCSYCGEEHRDVRLYSFLYECKKCHRPPRAVACPHCGTVWCLDEDRDDSHPARRFVSTASALPSESPQEIRRREHVEKKEELLFAIEKAELLEKLRRLEESLKRSTPKSEMDTLKEEFERAKARLFGLQILCDEARKEGEAKFANDPEKLKAWMAFIKAFYEDRI